MPLTTCTTMPLKSPAGMPGQRTHDEKTLELAHILELELSETIALKQQAVLFASGEGYTTAAVSTASDVPAAPSDLRPLVRALNRILRDCEGNSSLVERFDEITKIIYCKTLDERDSRLGIAEGAFIIRRSDTERSIATRVREKFQSLVENCPDLFPQRFSQFRMGDAAISELAKELAEHKLAQVSEDLKGLLYEEIIRNTFDKGENQQFFTPRPIVEFMVRMIGPSLTGTICDPACGTGGFLLNAAQYLGEHEGSSNTNLLGFEIDERLAWVSGVNLDMHVPDQQFTVSHINSAGSLSHEMKPFMETVDTIITNPPFGSDLSEREALNDFELGKGRASRRRGVLFIERCLDLLKPGGILGIVIDEGVLNSPSNTDTRRLILERSHLLSVVSLPDTAFMPYASVKASILFLQKKPVTSRRIGKDASTFFAQAGSVGRKPNGDPMVYHDPATGEVVSDSDLPEILTTWHTGSRSRQELPSPAKGQYFWANVSGTENTSFQKSGFRIDQAYHHPTRSHADEALRASCHQLKSVSEISELRNEGFIPSRDLPGEEITYLGLASIESHTGEYLTTQVNGSALKSAVKRFVSGDILFAKMRPELGKVCLIGDDVDEGFASAECLVLTPKRDSETCSPVMLPELLAILLRSDLAYGQIIHLVTGIGRPRISKTAIQNILLPIPPMSEQKRLLDLFHSSDADARSLLAESERALAKARRIRSDARRSLVKDILGQGRT